MKSGVSFINILCFLLLLFLTGCKGEEPALTNNRVILFYMGADDRGLYPDDISKIESLLEGWNSSIPGKLLVYQDSYSANSDNKRNPELFEIVTSGKEGTIKKVITTYPEQINSADPTFFTAVIKEVIESYPCDSYGLIVFSHGSGWLPKGSFSNPQSRSIIVDQTDEMDFRDFANALPANTFDFIIFEACCMAGIEVLYELKDKTDYILASSAEIVSPGFVKQYTTSLGYLYEKKANLIRFAKDIHEYLEGLKTYRCSSTLSIINTSKLDELGSWISATISFEDKDNIDLREIQNFHTTYNYKFFLDFEDYFSKYLNGNEEKEIQLTNLIDKCIEYRAATPYILPGYSNIPISKHCGITTHGFQKDYPSLNEEYKTLKWYKDILLPTLK